MNDPPGKSTDFIAEKMRKARQRRLEIQQMRSVFRALTQENQPPAGDPHSSVSRKEENNNYTSGEEEGSSSGRKNGQGLVYGHVAMMGRRRVMEDAVTVAPSGWLAGEYHFFAVYDGHGGAKVAEKCREKMHKCLEKHIEKAKKVPKEEDFDWEKVMTECFSTMDEELEDDREDRAATVAGEERIAWWAAAEESMVGSTAVVVLVGKDELVVANCGDSRAVLCQSGVPVALSRDHKPDRADEKERIEAAGGKVINWNGWRVQGVLATSRSLGDHYLRPFVTSNPEVTVVRRSESDEFLIIATDGLFDVVCNETACKVVKKCLSGKRTRRVSDESGASEAAAILAQLAIVKGSRDNISIIVVQLK
ncbi:Serine/threonine protein phosphatase [Handroanthus impetiginosus]|uniref:protein-serine/threonine phosphatase n=1 Tax=Handroanthus impetiginosus TaxID=429701 RepID=A0A2G9HU04_9LAMI|nr:Serine/threonine protein phosphatase [Handroanthus impetiginosus]